jgi:hypothetical protein
MSQAQRYNPALEITFLDRTGSHTHTLSAGHSDDLHVYREDAETYVLSINESLGYVGLQVFTGADSAGDIFLQDGQVEEILDHLSFAPFTIIRRLREYVNP